MNSTLLMMAAMGGRMDGGTLRKLVADANARRHKLFTRLAEMLFNAVFFLWGGLEYKATDASGKLVERKDYTPEQKLDALMVGLQTTQKGQLFREFLKPLVIVAAEFIADMLSPDELMLTLVSGGGGGLPALPGMMAPFSMSGGAQGAVSAGSYEGKLLHASDVDDGHVWRIEGGRKRHVTSPEVLKRYVSGAVSNGRWVGVEYVPVSVIDQFPTGSAIA